MRNVFSEKEVSELECSHKRRNEGAAYSTSVHWCSML